MAQYQITVDGEVLHQLFLGDEAEVLEPPELREMVIKTMAAGLERYSETNKRTEEIRNNKP